MGVISALFNDDIILDEAAFQNAAQRLEELSIRLQNLDNDIEDMLTTLQKGFDTAAGRKFVESCRQNLNQPMKDQKLVLDHISQTLAEVRAKYAVVFSEYQALNAAVKAYSHDA